MQLGLSVKLSILLACIGILSSGVTGYYAYSVNRSLLVAEAEGNLLTSTQLLSRRLTSTLNEMSDDVLSLTGSPSAASVAARTPGPSALQARMRLTQVFLSAMRIHQEYAQIRLITRSEHGLELIRIDRDGNRAVVVSGAQLQEKGQFPYVFETLSLAPGQVYVSPITVNHEQGAHQEEGRPTLELASPISGADGAVLGVVVINVELNSLLNYLRDDAPSGLQLFMANQWGDFLVHPNPALTFGFDKGQRFFIQDRFRATQQLYDRTQSSVVIDDRADQPSGQILAFIRVPFGLADYHQFFVLGLARTHEDVLSGGYSLGRRIMQMVLAFSALAILFAVVFARELVSPLRMLTNAVTHFSDDHMIRKLPLRRTDEIGVLARCFDKMCQEIRSHLDVMYRNQHDLTHLAHHDALTGLPNRTHFFQVLEQAIADAEKDHEQLAILFVDLDAFKQVNDQLGHAVGDQVLVAVARRLRRALRARDLVARLGGDEFIVLLSGPKVTEVVPGIAAKLLATLNEVLMIGNQAILVGASIGISLFPEHGRTLSEILSVADHAMYEAKRSGKGRVVFAAEQTAGPR